MSRRGYSLVEILFALGLMALLTFIALVYFGGATGRAGAHGLAMIAAEELRMARQEAITARRPVALIFPTGNGATPACTSMFLLEGETLPRITRSHGYAQEFPNCRMFVGLWPSPAPTSRNPALPGDKYASFELNAWLPDAYKKDFCFVFLPDGSVRTNDLPALGGSYHVVVASGVSYSAAGAPAGPSVVTPGPNYSQLVSSGECYTLDISPAGGIGMTHGLSLQDGSVRTEGTMTTTAASAPPPPVSAVSHQNPVLLFQPKIYPPQDPTILPPNTDAVLTRDDYLSLETVAVSPSGDPLYCNWVVTPDPANVGAGDGNYSMQTSGGGGRMEWDPDYLQPDGVTRGAWRAVWQWRPPPTALPDDKFALQCAVQNLGGAPQVAQIQKIVVIPPGRVLFQTDRNGADQVYSMNEDGSQQRLYQDDAYHPSATTNGSRIVYVQNGDLYLRYRNDPTRIEQLTNTPQPESIPAISPNGNCVAFRRQDALFVMKTRPLDPAVTVQDPCPPPSRPVNEKLAWSPDGRKLLFDHNAQIWAADISYNGGGGQPVVTSTGLFFQTHDPAEVPLTAMTWGFDNVVTYANDSNAPPNGYDPYVFRRLPGAASFFWWCRSSFVEESHPERDPGGGSWILEVHRDLAPLGNYQVVKFNTATVPMGANYTPQTLTSAGNNTRPVWTR